MLPDRNVLAGRHLVAHEVLEDDADLSVEGFQVVFAKVDSIQQDLPFRGIVQPSQQLDDRGLALPIFSDERDALAGMQMKIEFVEERCAIRRDTGKRRCGTRSHARMGLGTGKAFGLERIVGCISRNATRSVRKQGLIGDARDCRKNLLNVGTRLVEWPQSRT